MASSCTCLTTPKQCIIRARQNRLSTPSGAERQASGETKAAFYDLATLEDLRSPHGKHLRRAGSAAIAEDVGTPLGNQRAEFHGALGAHTQPQLLFGSRLGGGLPPPAAAAQLACRLLEARKICVRPPFPEPVRALRNPLNVGQLVELRIHGDTVYPYSTHAILFVPMSALQGEDVPTA